MPQLIDCPLCHQSNLRPYAARVRMGIPHTLRVICKDCGLIFANPQGTKAELIDFYQHYYDRGNFLGWKEIVIKWRSKIDQESIGPVDGKEIIVKRILSSFPNKPVGKKWLEIGAGLGQLSYLAKKLGCEVSITEHDQDAIDFMQKEMGIESCYLGDLTDLSLPEEYFDIVVMHHVLEHVTGLLGSLEKINSILKPGGLLFIGVPNLSSIGFQIYRGLSFLTFQVPDIVDGIEHTFGFTPKTLRHALESAGFNVNKIRTFGRNNSLSEKYKQKGVTGFLIGLAENTFHTNMDCIAIKY